MTTTNQEKVRGIWAAAVALDGRLAALTVPLVTSDRHVVTAVPALGLAMGGEPQANITEGMERVVLTPGAGARGGVVRCTAALPDDVIARDLVAQLGPALEGLELDKKTHVGLRLEMWSDMPGEVARVFWSVGRLAPVGALEVDVPPPLDAFELRVPVRLVESSIYDVEEDALNPGIKELRLLYELDLETLPAFDEPATRVKCEFRMRDFDLADPAWIETAAAITREMATKDLQEALGLLCGVASGKLSVDPRPDMSGVILVTGGRLSDAAMARIGEWVDQRKAGNLHSVLVLEGADVKRRDDGMWEVIVRPELPDPAKVVPQLFDLTTKAVKPLIWPMRVGAAVMWVRRRKVLLLEVLVVLVGLAVAAWFVFKR